MAFKEIAQKVKYPRSLSERYKSADRLLRFLDGTLYDDAKLTPFDQERTDPRVGEYIKLRERRPSVVSNFAGQFVEQCIGLLWADEQFPVVRCYKADDPDTQDTEAEKQIQHLVESIQADAVMARATYLGSVGSAAVVLRGLPGPQDGQPWFEVWRGYQCKPIFDPRNPTILRGLAMIYPVLGEDLDLADYEIAKDDLQKTFWMRIDLDAREELRYKPMVEDRFERIGEVDNGVVVKWEPDQGFPHKFGCVPAVWGKAPNADARDVDGPCIFGKAIDTIVELDYQLSQIGRAYKYTMDPLLAIGAGELNINQYSPAGSQRDVTERDGRGQPVRSADNTIHVPAGAKAELLELEGTGLTAALEYVQRLREYALESIGGMKSDSETQKGAQSGRALELLYQALVIVVKRQRLAWGNGVLLPMLDLTLRGIHSGEISVVGVAPIDPDAIIMRLKWPNWMTPTGADFLATCQAWQILGGGSATDPRVILPPDTVTRIAATNLGFQDAETLVKEVEEQNEKDQQDALDTADKTAAIEAKHAPTPAQGANN